MPMLWRVLLVLDRIKNAHIPDLSVHDLPLTYRLRSHGSSRFLFYSTSNDPLILRATRNEEEWKFKLFFVKRSSIPGGADYLVKWLRRADFRKLAPPLAGSEKGSKPSDFFPRLREALFRTQHPQSNTPVQTYASKVPILLDLEELDSYPTLVQVKKETPFLDQYFFPFFGTEPVQYGTGILVNYLQIPVLYLTDYFRYWYPLPILPFSGLGLSVRFGTEFISTLNKYHIAH
ncbi:hypothetical protein Hanom_Chr12g01178991 [Helianthus anomalus]